MRTSAYETSLRHLCLFSDSHGEIFNLRFFTSYRISKRFPWLLRSLLTRRSVTALKCWCGCCWWWWWWRWLWWRPWWWWCDVTWLESRHDNAQWSAEDHETVTFTARLCVTTEARTTASTAHAHEQNKSSFSFIYSFSQSFIQSFIHSFSHSFIHSFIVYEK